MKREREKERRMFKKRIERQEDRNMEVYQCKKIERQKKREMKKSKKSKGKNKKKNVKSCEPVNITFIV